MGTTCKNKAHEWVHWYAGGGAAFAMVPIPGTSAGLAAMETALIYHIGRIYGEALSAREIALVAGALEVASLGIKAAVIEGLNFIPVAGWILKAPVAASIIEGLGALVIKHFEDKHPGKAYSEADTGDEESVTPGAVCGRCGRKYGSPAYNDGVAVCTYCGAPV